VTIQKGIYWPSFSYASLAERERNLQWQRGVVMMGALAFFNRNFQSPLKAQFELEFQSKVVEKFTVGS